MRRTFIPGSEWLYYKIYTGPKISEKILMDIIHPLLSEYIRIKGIDKWFFIRYTDPHYHLRVRIHSTDMNIVSSILHSLNISLTPLTDDHLIWKIQLDTYRREIERYGEKTMDDSETLFYFDTDMVVSVLKLLDGEAGEKIRWMFAILAIDEFLNCFSFTIDEKHKIMQSISRTFGIEFNRDKNLNKIINEKYRKHRVEIEQFMSKKEEEYEPLYNLLELKNRGIEDICGRVKDLNHDITLFIESHIHMMMNRLFRSQQRLHELVIYDISTIFYQSAIARALKQQETC